jgi:HK97 family phage prohead protease
MQTVTRAYNFELRAENNDVHGDHIVGRPIVYESKTNLGWFDEVIERGALDGADLKDVRFLVNHNTDMIPLARSRNNNNNSTMQMQVDYEGMAIRVNLDTENNSDARNLYSAIKRGDITGMSFMFSIDSEEWEDLESEHPTRRIKQIGRVLEVSAVTFPAYDSTEISARDKEALDNAKATLESARSQSLDNDKNKADVVRQRNQNYYDAKVKKNKKEAD